jgi:transposase
MLALRSRMVLACATEADNRAVAERLGVTAQTVGKWRLRFIQRRLDGLDDDPRPGAPRKVTDEVASNVIRKTIAESPSSGRPWSTRALAHETGLSHSTVLRIWNAHGIRPNRRRGRRESIQRIGQIVPLPSSRPGRWSEQLGRAPDAPGPPQRPG